MPGTGCANLCTNTTPAQMPSHANKLCREEQLQGDAKLRLAVLAGQLLALREGLGEGLLTT